MSIFRSVPKMDHSYEDLPVIGLFVIVYTKMEQ